jgi:hypothetical protein
MSKRSKPEAEGKENSRSERRALLIHPLLFALWSVLFIYVKNQEFLPFSQVWAPMLLLLGSALILLLLFAGILRNWMKAGAIVSLLVLLFFSYGHVYYLLWETRATYAPTTESLSLMIAWAVIFAGGSAIVFRIKNHWQEITRALNVASLTLIVISASSIGIYEFREHSLRRGITAETLKIPQTESPPVDMLPNLYYIVLDAYARADVLKDAYNYDNSEFLNSLTEMGFFVADESLANYTMTTLSLASSLNLSYLDDLTSLVGSRSRNGREIEHAIKESALVQFLEENGYSIVALPSGYHATNLRSSNAHPGSGRTWNELEMRLWCSTPIPWLAFRGSVFDPYVAHREKVLFSLSHIADTSRLTGPQFVFAHVLAPHGPFVFDEHGNPTEPRQPFDLRDQIRYDEQGQISEAYVQAYTSQLAFVSNKILSVLEDLVAQPSRPTIVILQSDHGPGSPLDKENPSSTHLRDKLAILSAYFLPEQDYASLYKEVTPVNTFRLILNQYFGTELELLEDRSYYSTRETPYQLVDVTDKARSGGASQPAE